MCVAVQSRAKVVILWEQVTQTRIVKMLSVYLPLRDVDRISSARSKYCSQRNMILLSVRSAEHFTRSSRGIIVKKLYVFQRARMHTLTRAAAACCEQWKLCLVKKLSARRSCSIHNIYVYECVLCIADSAALLSCLISKSNNVRWRFIESQPRMRLLAGIRIWNNCTVENRTTIIVLTETLTGPFKNKTGPQ